MTSTGARSKETRWRVTAAAKAAKHANKAEKWRADSQPEQSSRGLGGWGGQGRAEALVGLVHTRGLTRSSPEQGGEANICISEAKETQVTDRLLSAGAANKRQHESASLHEGAAHCYTAVELPLEGHCPAQGGGVSTTCMLACWDSTRSINNILKALQLCTGSTARLCSNDAHARARTATASRSLRCN
jgi:hypothetical protein